MMSEHIFDPYQLGDLTLANRIVMAPMTRNRAFEHGIVSPIMATYYQQRAGAGLIISESTVVSDQGVGYPFTPGMFDESQAESWRSVTDAVHDAGSRIFVQLQHCGRISHPSMQPGNAFPVAPSALKPEGQAVTYAGMQDFVEPRPLDAGEILSIVGSFRRAARLAKQSGFDGIEIHGANGYLIDQFLRDGSNLRTDEYGGSIENRMRFLNEILDAVGTVWPMNRVGVRLSPENTFNSMGDSDPQAHFSFIAARLSSRGLAYMHVLEGDMLTKTSTVDYHAMRSAFSGTYMANNGYDLARAQRALQDNAADLVAFGVPFIANPDLVRRYKENLPLTEADHETFYMGGEKGYTDYPFYHEPNQQDELKTKEYA